MSESIPFLCECFPHFDRSVILEVVRENSGKNVDQLCSILLARKRKPAQFTDGFDDLEPAQKKRKSDMINNNDSDDDDDDDVVIIKTVNNPKRKKKKKKKKKKQPILQQNSNSRPGRSERSAFFARIHSSRMMSTDPPLFIGDGEDRELKKQKEKFRMKKLQFESELGAFRRKQATKWRSKGGSNPSSSGNPTSNEQIPNRRKQMTLDTLPGAYDSVPTYPTLNRRPPINTIAGLSAQEADPKKIGVDCLRFTNEYRKKQGLKDLKWNENLYNIAMNHSKRMGDKKCPFGHHGFNNRMQDMTRKCGAVSGAENVAWTSSQQEVAKETVRGWIGSPGHRKNIVSKQNFCAIAVYKNSEGRFYLTQLFCR